MAESKTALQTAAEFISSLITEDTALAALIGERVFSYSAPPSPSYPLVVFSPSPEPDTEMVGGAIMKTNINYTIRAIGKETGFAALDPVVAGITRVLHQAAEDGVIECKRTMPLERKYVENGSTYYERGGVFRIMVKGA